jgi:hypothetical protein
VVSGDFIGGRGVEMILYICIAVLYAKNLLSHTTFPTGPPPPPLSSIDIFSYYISSKKYIYVAYLCYNILNCL